MGMMASPKPPLRLRAGRDGATPTRDSFGVGTRLDQDGRVRVDAAKCDGCGQCAKARPPGRIGMVGRWSSPYPIITTVRGTSTGGVVTPRLQIGFSGDGTGRGYEGEDSGAPAAHPHHEPYLKPRLLTFVLFASII